MGNHNVLITNPQGGRSQAFVDNQTMGVCKAWLEEYGPAPIGWHYQIVNLNKKAYVPPEHILIRGYDGEGKLIDERKARIPLNTGKWYSPKKAKRDIKRMFKEVRYFQREKIWPEKVLVEDLKKGREKANGRPKSS